MKLMQSFYILSYLLLALWCNRVLSAEPGQALSVGSTAPDWMLTDIEGRPYSLYHELESGRDVVMVFWSSWCKFCRELLPDLDLFRLSLPQNTVSLLAMNIWEDGDPVGYFDAHSINLPLLLHADAIARRYGVSTTPGVVLVGTDKTIRYIRPPNTDNNRTIRDLQALLLKRVN